jgi:hypothetical protein
VGISISSASLEPLAATSDAGEAAAALARALNGTYGFYPNFTIVAGELVLLGALSSLSAGAVPTFAFVGNFSHEGAITFATLLTVHANGTVRVLSDATIAQAGTTLSTVTSDAGPNAPWGSMLAMRATSDLLVDASAELTAPAVHLHSERLLTLRGTVTAASLETREPCAGAVPRRPTCVAVQWNNASRLLPPAQT